MSERQDEQRLGTILKKCACAEWETCRHKWTLRYWADGRQRERSFADQIDPVSGRVRYGSGRRLARDAQVKVAHDKRAGVFVDPRLGAGRFGEECQRWLDHHPCAERTREVYQSVLDAHVRPVLGDRSLAAVAGARDDVSDLLMVRLGGKSASLRKRARLVIVGTLDEAVRAGKIPLHRCEGLRLAEDGPGDREDFVFPSRAQLAQLAGGIRLGLTVWLMRGCGLRISEALAVQKSCFRDGGTVLRVFEQASPGGRGTGPLKGRKKGEYRDIPVPAYLREMVRDMPDGYFFMTGGASFAGGGKLPIYSTYKQSFDIHAGKAGIPAGFTPHSLRHAFASALLARNVPITDVAKWLGHKNINVTYAVYGHLVPSSLARAVAVLDEEYTEWSQAA